MVPVNSNEETNLINILIQNCKTVYLVPHITKIA